MGRGNGCQILLKKGHPQYCDQLYPSFRHSTGVKMQRTQTLAWVPITGSGKELNSVPQHHPTSSTHFKLAYPVQPQEEPHLTEASGAPGQASDHKGPVGLCKAGEIQGIQCLGKGKWISAPAGGRKGRGKGQRSFVFP